MNLAILLLLLSTASLFGGTAWPGVEYSEVRAFAWEPDPRKAPQTEELIRPDMTLAEGVIDKHGVLLNDSQAQRLLAAQARRHKERPVAGCYNPHNAFVFYNAQKKPVAFLEVCFDCFGARTSPIDEQCDPDFIALATICSELKLPFGEKSTVKALKKSFDWMMALAKQPKPKAK